MKMVIFAAAASMAFLAAGACADAMVEQCPAHASPLEASGKTADATIFTYTVDALSQRTVDATLIADTDHGWFAWSVAGIPLVGVTRMDQAGTWPVPYKAWSSRDLTVAIPGGVVVKHAWVTNGRATGEATFNWDAKGSIACDVPGFEAPPSPAPAPVPPAAVASVPADATLAKPTAAPFDIPTCDKPFVAAAPLSGPPLNAAALGGLNNGLAAEATVIDVAVDGAGNILNAWVKGSTHSAFDKLAMAGALQSKYTGAVSYCRPVEGIAKYTAWYQPTS
ncbi:MAG TPA: hypothetical protein VK760_10595 [Candidatus Acidoferrales bacterium]|jgi:hypothetical protein|nr:hypothetical protein [Candidatus Acidoferrales bacterium]